MVNKYIRGSVWWCDLSKPNRLSFIQAGIRPVVIVSNDLGNLHSPVVTICPITSKEDSLSQIHPKVVINGKASYILTEQTRTVDKDKLYNYEGVLLPFEIKKLNDALRFELQLDEVDVESEVITQLNKINNILQAIDRKKRLCVEESVLKDKELKDTLDKVESTVTKFNSNKYNGMTQIEKFNAKYMKSESDAGRKTRKKSRKWTDEDKRVLIDKYDSNPKDVDNRNRLLKEYELTDIKMLQSYVAKFRKELHK